MSELRWEKIRDQLAGLGLVPANMPLGSFIYSPPEDGLHWQDLQPYLLASALGLALVFATIAVVMRRTCSSRTRWQNVSPQSSKITTWHRTTI